MKLVSEFKLETSISEETKHFCSGFWKVCVHVCIDYYIVALPYKTLKRIPLLQSGLLTPQHDKFFTLLHLHNEHTMTICEFHVLLQGS